jgi:histidyl-tRNA synthetase
VGGGGRYDGLSESIGGSRLPSVGWALGVERTLLALEAEGRAGAAAPTVDVFVIPVGESARAVVFSLVQRLRAAGVRADQAFDGRGVKGAMKAADRSGAALTVIIGDRDLESGSVQIKTMATGEQRALPIDDVVPTIAGTLAGRTAE